MYECVLVGLLTKICLLWKRSCIFLCVDFTHCVRDITDVSGWDFQMNYFLSSSKRHLDLKYSRLTLKKKSLK